MATALKRGLPPVHPGEVLKEMFIEERNLTITRLADGIGVDRSNLSGVINGHHGISPELAVKLSEAFGNSPGFWLNMQQAYDLWEAERKVNRKQIEHFYASRA
jgi:addiction module HigA family antidote